MKIREAVPRVMLVASWAVLPAFTVACRDDLPARGPARGLPALTTLGQVPLGDVAGVAWGPRSVAAAIPNPYAGDASARRGGEALFVGMNCVGCHGYDAQGGMGPNLTDDFWRYGGLPAQVFNSVYEGRPRGMSAYGQLLPPEAIWLIVTYVESLGGTSSRREVLAELGEGQRRGSSQRTMKGRQDETEK